VSQYSTSHNCFLIYSINYVNQCYIIYLFILLLLLLAYHYNRPFSQEEQKRVVINLYESGIAEEFIALQLDLEIPTVIGILKEYNIYRGNS
jgi:hypothetical protein